MLCSLNSEVEIKKLFWVIDALFLFSSTKINKRKTCLKIFIYIYIHIYICIYIFFPTFQNIHIGLFSKLKCISFLEKKNAFWTVIKFVECKIIFDRQ